MGCFGSSSCSGTVALIGAFSMKTFDVTATTSSGYDSLASTTFSAACYSGNLPLSATISNCRADGDFDDISEQFAIAINNNGADNGFSSGTCAGSGCTLPHNGIAQSTTGQQCTGSLPANPAINADIFSMLNLASRHYQQFIFFSTHDAHNGACNYNSITCTISLTCRNAPTFTPTTNPSSLRPTTFSPTAYPTTLRPTALSASSCVSWSDPSDFCSSGNIKLSTSLATIADNAFDRYGVSYCFSADVAKITSVIFTGCNSLKTIGNNSFQCNQITSLFLENLPALTSIRDGAFYSNRISDLTLSSLPALTSINGFTGNSLTSVILSSLPKLKIIEAYSFFGNQIRSVTFSNLPKISIIGDYSFNANAIASVSLGNLPSLERIGIYAFSGGNQIATLTLSSLPMHCSLLVITHSTRIVSRQLHYRICRH
jgi:hypothetical protein